MAQQYLPDTLQGKLFYQPSDQGYEAHIGEQVARRREAQLTAMLEAGDSTAPSEVLTFSPASRTRDRWLERAISGAGQRLARTRDRVLEAAKLQRHHLILDLDAGSGLLTWDALRRAPEGGVWALAADAASGEALRQRVRRLPELEQPVLLIGDILELPDLLALRGDEAVRFDAVVGRNILTRRADRAAVFDLVTKLLRPDGHLSLAQVIPRRAQRLTALLELSGLESGLESDLAERMREAEEAIYHDPTDVMVNWDIDDLVTDCRAGGLEVLEADSAEETIERRVSAADLVRWFSQAPAGERPSYADHLLKAISPAELEQVRPLFERQLANQIVSWSSSTLYLVSRSAQ